MKVTIQKKATDDVRDHLAHKKLGETFERFIVHNKGTGSTDAAIRSCAREDAVLVVDTAERADSILHEHKVRCTYMQDITPGRHIIDDSAIHDLVREYMQLRALAAELVRIIELKKFDL